MVVFFFLLLLLLIHSVHVRFRKLISIHRIGVYGVIRFMYNKQQAKNRTENVCWPFSKKNEFVMRKGVLLKNDAGSRLPHVSNDIQCTATRFRATATCGEFSFETTNGGSVSNALLKVIIVI